MTKNVIVPIDFSENSLNAAYYSFGLAKELSSDIHFVYVLQESDDYRGQCVENEQAYAIKKYEIELEKWKKLLGSWGGVDYEIRKGKIYQQIWEKSKENENSLLVFNVFGGGGSNENFIGGNAMKIASNSPCPAILLKDGEFRWIKKIVLPLDDSDESLEKLPFAIELAGVFDAEIHLVSMAADHVHEIRHRLHQSADDAIRMLKKNNVRYVSEFLIGDNIANITLDYAMQINADLIGIMAEKARSTSLCAIGVYAQKVIHHSPVPVLVIPSR